MADRVRTPATTLTAGRQRANDRRVWRSSGPNPIVDPVALLLGGRIPLERVLERRDGRSEHLQAVRMGGGYQLSITIDGRRHSRSPRMFGPRSFVLVPTVAPSVIGMATRWCCSGRAALGDPDGTPARTEGGCTLVLMCERALSLLMRPTGVSVRTWGFGDTASVVAAIATTLTARPIRS
jgi:hypothetical protein